MVTRLAQQLEIPLREQNALLLAAGYAPVFPERELDDPDFEMVRHTIDLILTGHEPVPALAIDRDWTLVAANRIAKRVMAGADASLLEPPVNVVRLSLHPDGLASRIINLDEWREHMIQRLRRDIELSGSKQLLDLVDEVRRYRYGNSSGPSIRQSHVISREIAIPFQVRLEDTVLSFYTTTTVFGTPTDVTLSELAIESFFPADSATSTVLATMMDE